MFTTTKASVARPADTTQYTANDLVANSTSAGSVVPLKFSTEAVNGRGRITRVTLFKDDETVTAAKFTVHLFSEAPSISSGDNAAMAVASARNYLGGVAVDMSSGALATSTDLAKSAAADIAFDCRHVGVGENTIYGLIQATDAYACASGELFEVTLDIEG